MQIDKLLKDKKLWIAAAAVVILIVVIVLANQKSEEELVYKYEKISKGEVEKTVSVNGSLDLYERVFVYAPLEGTVFKKHVNYNQQVKKGDLLLELSAPAVEEQFEEYKDTYKFAKIDLQNAYDLFVTKKKLYQDKLISEKEYSDTKVAYQREQSKFNQTKKEYENLQNKLENRMVQSPVDGVIVNTVVEDNSAVSQSQLLYEIAPSLDKMKMIIDVDESDIGVVNEGLKVTFAVSAYPDEEFTGKITEVRMSPKTDQGVVTYESMVVCQNKDSKLKPGMSATVTVHVGNKSNVVRVPNQAFLVNPKEVEKKPGEKYVWVKGGGEANLPVRMVQVKTGLVGDSFTEIVAESLQEGEEILVAILRVKKK